MEHDVAQLWKTLQWGFGLSFGGFTFLAGWIWVMVGKLNSKVSYDWIEDKFTKQMADKFHSINIKFDVMDATLRQVRDALCGSFQDRGLIQAVDDTKKELIFMKENCKEIQAKKNV